MEALVGLWAAFDDLAPWAAVPWAPPSVGALRYGFEGSWQSSQPSPVCSWGCTSWNAWSGIGVWDAAEQAAVSALTAVGAALEAALQALRTFWLQLITSMVKTALSPILSVISSDVGNIYTGFNAAKGGQSSSSLFQQGMAPLLIGGVAIAIVTQVIITIATPETAVLGPVSSIIIPLLMTLMGGGLSAGTFVPPSINSVGVTAWLTDIKDFLTTFFNSGGCAAQVAATDLVIWLAVFGVMGLTFGVIGSIAKTGEADNVVLSDDAAARAARYANIGMVLIALAFVFMFADLVMLSIAATPTTSCDESGALLSLVGYLDVVSLVADVIGLLLVDNPAEIALGGAVVGIDVRGLLYGLTLQ